MVQSRGERLSIWAAASVPSMDREADARSAPRPTRTADRVTGAPAGTWALALGTMVRTMGGAATAEGDTTGAIDATGEGFAATPGEGLGRARKRSAWLGSSVGGTPGGVAASLPGCAPRSGRSLAGAQLATPSARRHVTAAIVLVQRRCSNIRLSLCISGRKLKNNCLTDSPQREVGPTVYGFG